MSMFVVCPKCQKRLKVEASAPNQTFKCPGCAAVFAVRSPAGYASPAAAPVKMSQPPPRNEEIATAGGEVAGPPRPGQAGVGRNRRGAANPGADDCRRSKRKEKGSAIVIVAILFGLASVLLLACSGLGVYFIFRWHSGKGTDAMADGRADPNTHLTTVREDGKAHAVGKITLDRKGDEQPTEVGKEEPKAGAEREAPPAKEKLQQRSPGREKRQGESRRPYLVAQLGHGLYVESLAFSPDGKQILTGSRDKTARLWDTVTGELIRRFTGMGAVASVAFSPDGKQVLTGSSDKTARLWDAATGKEIRRFTGHTEWVNSVAFSPDGKHVLTGSSGRRDKTARLWDAATGKEIRRFTGHVKQVDSVAFSPDGKHVLTDSSDKTVRLWNVATGKEIRRFTGSGLSYDLVAFSPDGKQFLTTGRFEGVHLWDAATGKETVLLGRIAIFRNSSSLSWGLNSVAFSPDGKQVLTCGGDETVHLWDVATGKEIRQFVGHTDEVTSVAFSLDGKYVLSGSWDMTTRVWDAAAGKELVQLLSFQDGSWAVVDTDGRFDTSNGGGIEGLHWVVGNEPIALSQLKARYYEPGLLAKKLGFNKEPLRRVDAFVDPKLFPEVRLTEPARDRPRLGITLTNRGGGIGRVVVLINGRELTSDARGPKPDANAAKLQLEVNLANDPRLVPGQENVIEVHAYNAEGYLRSCGMRRTFTLRGKTDSPPPELWLVVAGVSDYRGDTLDLQYAAKDADDFAQAVRIAGERLFGAEKIHLRLLTTTQEGAERQPSRANLMAALKAAQKAKPGDVLVVYLAGHGINYGGQDGDFYYLCCDAADANLADSEIRKQVALSSNELTELLKLNPAQKQVLVLDTCASGKLIEKLTEKRDVPSSQIRALELVKDRTGMYILAGCASDAVSYEATRFAQGVLTYSLLLGMRGAALKEDRVEVGRLFEFAADKVPELARDIGGIQKPVIASPKGGQPFPIGRLTAEDQARIPLQAVRPLVLRCSLQDEVKVRDHLGLSKRVNERLREASASGRSAKLVFVEAEEFPEAYGLTGRYRLVGETVTVTLTLFHGADEVARFKVEGSKTDLNALAGQIVREAEQRLESEQRTPKK